MPNTDPRPFHQRYSWQTRYLRDWGACGEPPSTIRLWATLGRWYSNPQDRAAQFAAAFTWGGRAFRPLAHAHQQNISDLLDLNVQLNPGIRASAFCWFLEFLHNGDVIAGGPTSAAVPKEIVDALPGYAFTLSCWYRAFGNLVMPWNYVYWMKDDGGTLAP